MTLAAVGFGANLGDPEAAFGGALDALVAVPGVRLAGASGLWRTAPWGPVPQPEFLNAAALLATTLAPRALLDALLAIERRAGRRRGVRWGPRTLDLDLLFVGATVVREDGLEVPHPRLEERSFVLAPLAEVASDWRHPASGRTVAESLRALRGSAAWTACARIGGRRLGDRPVPEAACPR